MVRLTPDTFLSADTWLIVGAAVVFLVALFAGALMLQTPQEQAPAVLPVNPSDTFVKQPAAAQAPGLNDNQLSKLLRRVLQVWFSLRALLRPIEGTPQTK